MDNHAWDRFWRRYRAGSLAFLVFFAVGVSVELALLASRIFS